MRLVVADTGPLNYLILIEAVDLLPKLFEHVLIPAAVYAELNHTDAPELVRAFAAAKPTWLEVHPDPTPAIEEWPMQPWTKESRPRLRLLRQLAPI